MAGLLELLELFEWLWSAACSADRRALPQRRTRKRTSWRGVAPGFGVRVHYPIGLVHVSRVSGFRVSVFSCFHVFVFSCFRVFVFVGMFVIFVLFVSRVTYAALRDTLGAS